MLRFCRPSFSLALFFLSYVSITVNALGGPTDTTTWGGDNTRSGYQTNHNMDPAVVASADFGQIFKTLLPGTFEGKPEQIYSQPLVFTANNGEQHVYLATTQNNLYKLDAKTGAILVSRKLKAPFLYNDIDTCPDINPTIGVIGTGVIDASTGYWYFFVKTYSDQFQDNLKSSAPPGRANGRYYFYGVDTQSSTLADVFAPTSLEGTIFRNNANRMFLSGNQLQRPGLLLVGDNVYAGFGSHCVKYNYTGAIFGMNKNNGVIVEAFASQAGLESNQVQGGSVWMSGGGLSFDGKSMYFVTGNGHAGQLSDVPLAGRQPPTSLEEAAVNAVIQTDGTLKVIDFFIPWEKQQLDGGDQDLGTGPFALLPDTFSCPNVKRMGVITGKSGKTYFLNVDNLGGYRMGSDGLDAVLYVYQNENSVYAGAGVLPMGNFVYINIINYPTRIWKVGCDNAGNPTFTIAGYTDEKSGGVLGVSHGTTTSLNGREGTGLLWINDRQGPNLRIYDAVPVNSKLRLLKSFVIPTSVKFTRAVFGNGRAYVGTYGGYFYGFGSPVNRPINCTSSGYNFGNATIGQTIGPVTFTCTANTKTTLRNVSIASDDFALTNAPALITYNASQTFVIKAIFKPTAPGSLAADLLLEADSAASGFSKSIPILLQGTGRSVAPIALLEPNQMSFSVTIGSAPTGVNQSSVLTNAGDTPLTVNRITYSLDAIAGPYVDPVPVSGGGQKLGDFIFYNMPATVPANDGSTFIINYNPTSAGSDKAFLSFDTDGGKVGLTVVATGANTPKAVIEFEKIDGSGWVPFDASQPYSLGSVEQNTQRNLRLRISNAGVAPAAGLTLTISKPPYGLGGIIGTPNGVDLGEGTVLTAGSSSTAVIYCNPPKRAVNTPAYNGTAKWTFATNDPSFGKVEVQFTCTAVSRQVGPLLGNGSARYSYLGCQRDMNPDRLLPYKQSVNSTTSENGNCINTCLKGGYIFAGTLYKFECWCGNSVPNQPATEGDCNYPCRGDSNQTCGGNGLGVRGSYESIFYDSTRFSTNGTTPVVSSSSSSSSSVVSSTSKTTSTSTSSTSTSTTIGITTSPSTSSSTSLTTSSSSSISSSSSAISASPTVVASVGTYTYQGCYNETTGRTFNASTITSSTLMTIGYCANFCKSYAWFGVEYGSQCYCGPYPRNGSAARPESECKQACAADASQLCGGSSRLNVYSSPDPAKYTIDPVQPQRVGNYSFIKCVNDNSPKALGFTYTNDSMTVSQCMAIAEAGGYTYAGLEYGKECRYGNTLNNPATATTGCNKLCAGNGTEFCGNVNKLSFYQRIVQ